MTGTIVRVLSLLLILIVAAPGMPCSLAADAGRLAASPVRARRGSGAAASEARADAPPGDSAPGSRSADGAGAIDHYLAGRLLEERGQDEDALDQYRQALDLSPEEPEIELRMSEVAARLGEARRSLEYAQRVLEREPGQARALWLVGGAQFNLGQLPAALTALQAAVAADSTQVEYWRTLAHVAEQLDQIALVADSWRHAVELDDDDGESWFQLAAAEARLGHFTTADSTLAEAVAINPVRPGALFLEGWIQESLGHPERAIQLYRHHLELHSGDQVTRRRLVNLLANAGQLTQAYDEARVVGAAEPDNPDAITMEADLALRLGHEQHARELLDRLQRVDPDDAERVGRVVDVLARRGHGPEAVARAESWAGSHPQDYQGQMLVAEARAQSGDFDSGLAAARRAVQMAPDSLGPRVMLGGLLQGRKRYAQAESVWVDLIQRVPSVVSARLNLAFCREQQGDLSGAVGAAREVLGRDPDNASALNFLGYIYADHAQHLDEAQDLIRRALEQEPDNGAYVDSMGWVYYRLGRLTDARRELERAVELTHGDPVVREHLGDVYRDMKLFDLARQQYKESLSRDQGNVRVRAKLAGIR